MMKIKSVSGVLVFWLLAVWAASPVHAAEPVLPPAGVKTALHRAVSDPDKSKLRQLLREKVDVNARDEAGNTALHLAVLSGDVKVVAELLAHHADAKALNRAGATALHYATGSTAMVTDLLDHGANPNVTSTAGMSPLMAAVIRADSFAVAKLLVDHGADVRAQYSGEEAPLRNAIFGGDRRTIQLLLDRGASVNQTQNISPLVAAAFVGDVVTLRQLLDRGANPNFDADFAGHALNHALYSMHPECAALLIERGSDLKFPTPRGQKTTPMVFAGYTQDGDATVARLLLAKGVDVNTADESGATALAYALRSGPKSPLVDVLVAAGAKMPPPSPHVGVKYFPLVTGAADVAVRARVQLAVDALQRSSDVFLEKGFFNTKPKCISCHQQSLPAVTFAMARERGLTVNETSLGRQFAVQLAVWAEHRENALQLDEPLPDSPVNLGYGAVALQAWHYAPSEVTSAMSRYLLATQRFDGSWPSFDRRPPIEDGLLVGTAWAVRMLQLYPPSGGEKAVAIGLRGARRYFEAAKPTTQNERAFQLFGLSWAGETPAQLRGYVKRLVAEQRPDGGWAQLPGLESDAWATGQALVALHEAGGVETTDPAYRRGVEFLLRTQFEDGTWWVHNRTWAFQPHFDGQFPHGKDQWISAAGTAWAASALLYTVKPATSVSIAPNVGQLVAAYQKMEPVKKVASSAAPAGAPEAGGSIDFVRDIHPLFERSCEKCHSGEKPRGRLTLATREGLLKGGQSGDPAVVPGNSAASPLLDFITDHVEDLEMPPLNKREKFPPLSSDEVQRVRAWIDQGAPWSAP